MRSLSLSFVLCLIAGTAFGWNGKQDMLRIALGMSPAEVQKANGSCRPLDQVRKSQRLWSDKNEPGEMECKGSDGILRVQFTVYEENPKSYSIIYYFTSSLNYIAVQSSIETQYALSNPSFSADPIFSKSATDFSRIYSWQTETRPSPTMGIGLFLATPKSGRDYVLRLTDHDLMMNDYNLRPEPVGQAEAQSAPPPPQPIMSPAEASQVRTAIANCQLIAENRATFGDLPENCVKLLQLYQSLPRPK
jgi:hypothetical protein